MFDFDELDDAEGDNPSEAIPALAGAGGSFAATGPPSSAAAAAAEVAEALELLEATPAACPAGSTTDAGIAELPAADAAVAGVAASAAANGTSDAPPRLNSRYCPGMMVESTSTVLMRRFENLESEQLGRLPAQTRAEVLERGSGPAGKRLRIRLRAALAGISATEGWVSVVSNNSAPLWVEVQSPPAVASTAPAGAVLAAVAAAVAPTAAAPAAASASAVPTAAVPSSARAAGEQSHPARAAPAAPSGPSVELRRPFNGLEVGDAVRIIGKIVVRSREPVAAEGNPILATLQWGKELTVQRLGSDPEGKRILIREAGGLEGWVSVVNQEGTPLLERVRRKADVPLFVGAGQTLGGGGCAGGCASAGPGGGAGPAAADVRAAALAAAERRQASAKAHGLGEAKVKSLKEQEQRDLLLKKINDSYARRREDVPLAMHNSTLAGLQKHLEYLSEKTSPASPSAASSRPPPFRPPARNGASPAVPPSSAAAAAAGPPKAMDEGEQKRLLVAQARRMGLSTFQLRHVSELEDLGFDYGRALEAYLACDRSKEMAANFLFDSPMPEEVHGAAMDAGLENVNLNVREWEAVERLQGLGFDRPTSLWAFFESDKDEEAAGNWLLM
mmetsp:Transcript_73770/g.240288  ORF Transcript_73770/g.240288 Transcript_73770/m.240288 type:complete len:618 (+) Transcript_73770:74-1927(+)